MISGRRIANGLRIASCCLAHPLAGGPPTARSAAPFLWTMFMGSGIDHGTRDFQLVTRDAGGSPPQGRSAPAGPPDRRMCRCAPALGVFASLGKFQVIFNDRTTTSASTGPGGPGGDPATYHRRRQAPESVEVTLGNQNGS